MRIPFGVAYGADKDQVKTAVLEAAERVPVTLRTPAKYEPQVWLVGIGGSSLNFELIVWVSQVAVKRPSSVAVSYLWEIETSLSQYGIEIPFPQRDLNIRSLFDKRGADACAGARRAAVDDVGDLRADLLEVSIVQRQAPHQLA